VLYKDGRTVGQSYSHPIDEVQLVSYGGRHLHGWGSGALSIRFAKLVNRPEELGGGRLALLGFSRLHEAPLRGALCAFDISGNLEEPVWRSRVASGDGLPDPYSRDYTAEDFDVGKYWLYDVFPSQSGPEVVVTYQHMKRSQIIIRIYGLQGELLYQVWLDGTIQSSYWMADARLLVFAGSDASVNWGAGGTLLAARSDPLVVFAVQPTIGHVIKEYLHRYPADDDVSLAWWKYLSVNGQGVGFESGWVLDVLSPTPASETDRSVQVYMKYNELDAEVSWDLDELGNEIPKSRVVGNAYERNQLLPDDNPRKLPAPYAFKLSPTPPIVSTSQASETSPEGGNEGK